jgi:hypothetical protein
MSPGAEDIRDIKAWAPLTDAPLWVIALALALALAASLWLWWRRRQARPVLVEAAPFVDPGPTPWQRLMALRQAPVSDPEGVRRFHFALSESFRAAIEERFSFPATDRTTEELKRGLRGLVSELGKVMSVLEAADRVKFTDYRPTEAGCRELLEEAVAIVESWRKVEGAAMPTASLAEEGAR